MNSRHQIKKFFICFLAVTSVMVVAPAWAEESKALSIEFKEIKELTLTQAITLALRHNPDITASSIDMRIAEALALEASGLDDFVLLGNTSWLTDRNQIGAGGIDQNPFDRLSLNTEILRPLPTGGQIGLRLSTDFWRFNQTLLANKIRPTWVTPSWQLYFSHPLLKGAGVNIARANRFRANVERDIASLQKESVLAKVLSDVTKTYWELYYATAQLKIKKLSLDLATEQLHAVKANIEVGKQPPSASAEVEVAIAIRNAEVVSAQQVLKQRSTSLLRLLGLPIKPSNPLLTAVDSPEISIQSPKNDEVIKVAMNHNPELLIQRQQKSAANIEAKVSENGMLPQLDFEISAGPLGNAADASNAFAQMAKFNGYSVMASLNFSYPLQQNVAKSRLVSARERQRKAQLAEAEIIARICENVMNAVNLVQTAKQRIEILSLATQFASLDLEAERARFSAGRSSNFDVLRRQDGRSTAQLQEERARADYLQSVATLEGLTAHILNRYGVSTK